MARVLTSPLRRVFAAAVAATTAALASFAPARPAVAQDTGGLVDGWDLIGSTFDLTDIDLLSGALMPLGAEFGAMDATAVVVDMVNDDQMAFDTARLAEEARRAAEARKRLEDARRAAAGRSFPGVPQPLTDATIAASSAVTQLVPTCKIDAAFLLGVAKTESGSYWDRIGEDGVMRPPLYATEPMRGGDTDNGRLDGRTDRDFAVGAFQFGPQYWDGNGGKYGIDGSGDGIEDPQNVYDAALAAAWSLCDVSGGADLITDRNAALEALGRYAAGWNWRNESWAVNIAQRKLADGIAYRESAVGGPVNAQVTVGPDGCPTAVPANTLRNGAASVGAHELCARSVAQAATPAAANAIKFMFQNLGAPYSGPNRMTKGWFDCSSYVSSAYEAAGVDAIQNGWAPTTRELAPYPGYRGVSWLHTVSWEARRPGDLAVTPPTRSDGGGHVMMVLADGFMIHTGATGDVSNVTTLYPQHKIMVIRRSNV